MRMRRLAGAAAVVALAAAAPLAAQEHGGTGQPGMMMHGMGGPGPEMMLKHRQELGLSDAQVRRLETIVATQRQAMQRQMPEAMRAMADLMEAASGDVDVQAARAAFDRVARIHGDMLVARLTAMKEARQLLSAEQRTRWDAMAPRMRMHGGARGEHGTMKPRGR